MKATYIIYTTYKKCYGYLQHNVNHTYIFYLFIDLENDL